MRDPRDIGLAIFTYRFHGQHGYTHDLADLGWTIAQQERIMAPRKAVLPNPVLTVKLSDWVEDFNGTLQRVLTLVDLPHDANCARGGAMEDVRGRTAAADRGTGTGGRAGGLGRLDPRSAGPGESAVEQKVLGERIIQLLGMQYQRGEENDPAYGRRSR